MNESGLMDQLEQGLAALCLSLNLEQRHALIEYVALLARWNRAYNLTAVDDPEQMIGRHLLDSLSIAGYLRGPRVLDAGTGAGLPGVPLAIAMPDCKFCLVDSNSKKVRFLRQVRRELGLDNIDPVHARLENLADEPLPDDIVARALAPLPRLVEQLGRFIDRGSRLLAMKGRLEQDECDALAGAYNVERIELNVPGERAQRCLAIVTANQ